MQLADGTLVFSASDLTGFLACEHLLRLELRAAVGELVRPERIDPELDVLTRRGLEHERRFLEQLRWEGKTVCEIGVAPDQGRELGAAGLRAAHEATVAAMRSGVDVIYQAAFFDGRWLGYADFLLRVKRPSALGPYSYEVADTKLARHVKAAALLQTCAYSEQLEREQGVTPERIHVVLGDRAVSSFRYRDFAAYYRSVKRRFEQAANAGDVTYPDPVEHCAVCRWVETCLDRRRRDDHLSFVAGLTREQTRKLGLVGISTLAHLVSAEIDHVKGIGDPTLERLRRQARLQLAQRNTGAISYELLEPAGPDKGLARLPEPSPGDLFFDMEGDPLVEDGGLQYLFGVAWRHDAGTRSRAFWAHDRTAEKKAFEDFIDFVMERLRRYPDLHVYHYAAYEETALKSLMGTHATREDEVDRLLREGILVDLYRIVQQGIACSQESYSLKKLEPLYMGAREGAIKDAGSSIVAYEQWLESREQRLLDEIEAYNREDCVSTLLLREWLEARREEAEQRFDVRLERPAPPERPTEAVVEPATLVDELVRGLTADVTADPAERSVGERARWLLAQLLGWHRREAKSEWWAYFARTEMTTEELYEDDHAISGLERVGEPTPVARSVMVGYRFDPAQESRIREGERPHDPATRRSAGEVVSLDKIGGRISLKRSAKLASAGPAALIPSGPIGDAVMREALQRIARWVLENGIDAPGRYRAARDLLLERPPRVRQLLSGPLVQAGETALAAARRLALELDDGCLAIQGPPGAGKTYTGGWMAVNLVRAGKKVGVVATSHKVVGNLLREICDRADEQGVAITVMQRADKEDAVRAPQVSIGESGEVEAALRSGAAQVVGGTAWLFSRQGMADQLDVLFIDEAGQMSLANVVAVSQAAKSIVLLGDPNQLAQPSQGAHPPGAGVSALEHLLGGRETIPPDRGLFLDRTFRMRPDVCAFVSEAFYEGRLAPDDACDRQRIAMRDGMGGTGVRFAPVDHIGNRIASEEEAEAVGCLVKALIGASWTDQQGLTRPLEARDILVTAPYNAQVELLARSVPAGVPVGTVDKFQGQQAPVAIYSMATSSPEDMPRGMDFLYSRNRLNVAVSRAFALAIVVCSPKLLQVRCKTPAQMRLANALCLFEEMASGATERSDRG